MKNKDNVTNPVSETIKEIREKQNAMQNPASLKAMVPDKSGSPALADKPSRKRVSKTAKPASMQERQLAMNTIIRKLLLGDITQGQALKTLRSDVLGLQQDVFANLVTVSRKTLSEVENDRGNYTSEIINKLFKPFGLKVGLVPTSRHRLAAIFKEGKPE